MSLSTMPDPCEPVVFAAGLGDVVFGGWRMSKPVGPVDDLVGVVAARFLPPFLRGVDLRWQFRAARRVRVLA
jgi:hypothetical protein